MKKNNKTHYYQENLYQKDHLPPIATEMKYKGRHGQNGLCYITTCYPVHIKHEKE